MPAPPNDDIKKEFGKPPLIAPTVRKAVGNREYSYLIRTEKIYGNTVRTVNFFDETNDRAGYKAEIALPLLTPKLTKAGKVAARQPHVTKAPLKWWKAQCAFRGLPVSGSIGDLQARIREHGNKGMSKAVQEAREAMEREYMGKNMEALDKIWLQGDNEAKAKAWPQRFLYEHFTARPEASNEVFFVEVNDWGNGLEEASRQLKMHCEMRIPPKSLPWPATRCGRSRCAGCSFQIC